MESEMVFQREISRPDVQASGGRGMGRAGRRFGGDAGIDGWMEGGRWMTMYAEVLQGLRGGMLWSWTGFVILLISGSPPLVLRSTKEKICTREKGDQKGDEKRD